MHLSHLLVPGLLASSAGAARNQKIRRQNGPTDPGIPSDCTYWEPSEDASQDCAYIEDLWELDHDTFVEYNPSVKNDCSGIQVGHSYCVEVNNGFPREEEPPKATSTKGASTKATEPEPTKGVEHSPAQDGLIESCTAFYKAKKGDTCAKVIAAYGTFKFNDFFKWNPAVGEDCSGIWADTWYCVGVPGTPTGVPTKTMATTTTTKAAGSSKPSTTQEGLIESCTSFHPAAKGETCAKIVSNFGTFDFDTFFKWNPAVGEDCSGIWAGYYYCVGVPGTPTAKPSATAPKPTATGGSGAYEPQQEGLAKNCNKYHKIASTTTCSSIESYYKLPFAQFFAWNPAVEKDCSGLWVGYWVCVSVEGYTPTMTTVKATMTKPANGISTPPPVQNGMVKNCDKFHQIKSTTTCASIEDYYSLPSATFHSWNPAVGNDCKSLLVGYWVCVGTVGWKPPTKTTASPTTPTKASNGITTPSPIQSKMVGNCNKFHMVTSTTTCSSIRDYYKISLADFGKWNPAVGADCANLWAGYNVCIGVIGGTPTKPGNGIETPSPIQPNLVSNCKKFHKVTPTTTCASIQKYYKISMAQLAKWNPTVGSGCDKLWANYWVCVAV
ncbi:hypothetical protein DER45DRAFT_587025 [Fusarium avenaceum]|nr:hypothetical protein DER45DRAFT_587025 [Fusarium avenaceum]